MQPSRRDKLKAHAEHLLDAYLGLRSTYAMLEPLLFDGDTAERWGAGARSRGFVAIRSALLHSCILDIANIALDKDHRTPSVASLVVALDDQLVAELREEFAVWSIGPSEEEEPDIMAALQRMEQREEGERRKRFDLHVHEVRTGWAQLSTSAALNAFRTMRDKYIAHKELWHDAGSYRPLDISTLGLKYGDIRGVILQLEPLIGLLTLIYRNSSFAFEGLEGQLSTMSQAFWRQV